MDSRSTFRPRTGIVINVVGTQKGRPTGDWLCRTKQVGGGAWQTRCLTTPRRERERGVKAPRSGSAHAAKKSCDVRFRCARTANRHR